MRSLLRLSKRRGRPGVQKICPPSRQPAAPDAVWSLRSLLSPCRLGRFASCKFRRGYLPANPVVCGPISRFAVSFARRIPEAYASRRKSFPQTGFRHRPFDSPFRRGLIPAHPGIPQAVGVGRARGILASPPRRGTTAECRTRPPAVRPAEAGVICAGRFLFRGADMWERPDPVRRACWAACSQRSRAAR